MTEIAHRASLPTGIAPTDLQAWLADAAAAHSLATSLCKTAFVPAAFRNKPEEGAAAILAGKKWGLDPLASLNAFDSIQGTPAPKAITLRAVVQAAGHRIEYPEVSPTRVRAVGHRNEGVVWTEVESVWDLDRAKGLGLLDKDNWKKQPQAMLVARATSEVARLIAADAILGIAYSAEELRDDPTITGEVVPDARAILEQLPPADPQTGEVEA